MKEVLQKTKDSEENVVKKEMEIKDLKMKIVKSEEVIILMKRESSVLNEELEKLRSDIETKDDLITLKEFVMQDTIEKKDKEIDNLKAEISSNEKAINKMEKQSEIINEEIHNMKLDLHSKDKLLNAKYEVEKQLTEEQAKCSSLKTLNTRNEFIDEELKIKAKEVKEMKVKILNDEETIGALKNENQNQKDLYNIQLKKQHEKYKVLALKYKELMETKRSKDETMEGMKKALAEKEEKIKGFKEWNGEMFKQILVNNLKSNTNIRISTVEKNENKETL